MLTTIIPVSRSIRQRSAIAIKEGMLIDGKQFFAEVSAITAVFAQRQEKRWALYCSDTYEFLVAFLGLLQAGKTVILLPNVQTEFVRAILEHFDAIVCDKVLVYLGKPQVFLNEINYKNEADYQLSPIDSKLAKIELFTSGSTGTPKRIEKTLAQFEQEIETLETTWGIERATVLATVSHQHIYGLLFRVLWPLMTGRCFNSYLYQYPEELLAEIQRHSRVVLISSPAHLTRIPDQIDLSGVSKHLAAVFSSGGPLNSTSAIKLNKTLGIGITEVFGSSETGGVAYRTQTEAMPSPPWTPLPQVDIKIEPQQQCLMVRSPWQDDWYLMSDRVEINADGEFYLRGRADKIVKIEEKRLSLTEMETQLLKSELIKETVVTVLEGGRQMVAVVAVLTQDGQKLLADKGKKVVNDTLKSHLKHYFEAVVLPRKWRYVDSLPMNSQGKLTTASLQQLFSAMKPKYKILERNSKRIILELNIPENLHYFKGHFDNHPILPGVVQIDWVMAYSRKYLSVSGDMIRMEAVKFSKLIEPDYLVRLILQFNSEKRNISFSYESELGKHSSGRIVLG